MSCHKTDVLKASYLGTFLYFAAGLLPDPEGPFQPERPNWYTWILAIVFEAVIIVLTQVMASRLGGLGELESAETALGAFRVATLLVMSIVFALIDYSWRITRFSAIDEREGLLENSVNGSGYGITATPKPRIRDAQSTGWLDYFVGFSTLFPYIW